MFSFPELLKDASSSSNIDSVDLFTLSTSTVPVTEGDNNTEPGEESMKECPTYMMYMYHTQSMLKHVVAMKLLVHF